MKVYIHAIDPHYSATWADYFFGEGQRWHWVISTTKAYPLEPLMEFGCQIMSEYLASAIDTCRLNSHLKWSVMPPKGENMEYEEYKKHPKRFDNPDYDPQNLASDITKSERAKR